MANTYQIYLQTVFAVKYRKALLHKEWQKTLFGVIGQLIIENNAKTIIIGGVEDHVHCFFGLKPVMAVAELMKTVKAKAWQEGYGVFSYSRSQVDKVYRYIEGQDVHHQKQSFREEYLALLQKFNIAYDERYIFHDPL